MHHAAEAGAGVDAAVAAGDGDPDVVDLAACAGREDAHQHLKRLEDDVERGAYDGTPAGDHKVVDEDVEDLTEQAQRGAHDLSERGGAKEDGDGGVENRHDDFLGVLDELADVVRREREHGVGGERVVGVHDGADGVDKKHAGAVGHVQEVVPDLLELREQVLEILHLVARALRHLRAAELREHGLVCAVGLEARTQLRVG